MSPIASAAKRGPAEFRFARWLRRDGLARLAQIDLPVSVCHDQRAQPRAFIHLDTMKLVGFNLPGHRMTGSRVVCLSGGAGRDFHVAVSDATRPADAEVLVDERKHTLADFLPRAVHGIRSERVITKDGRADRSCGFAKDLMLLGIHSIFTRPLLPKTIGKAERVMRTRLRE